MPLNRSPTESNSSRRRMVAEPDHRYPSQAVREGDLVEEEAVEGSLPVEVMDQQHRLVSSVSVAGQGGAPNNAHSKHSLVGDGSSRSSANRSGSSPNNGLSSGIAAPLEIPTMHEAGLEHTTQSNNFDEADEVEAFPGKAGPDTVAVVVLDPTDNNEVSEPASPTGFDHPQEQVQQRPMSAKVLREPLPREDDTLIVPRVAPLVASAVAAIGSHHHIPLQKVLHQHGDFQILAVESEDIIAARLPGSVGSPDTVSIHISGGSTHSSDLARQRSGHKDGSDDAHTRHRSRAESTAVATAVIAVVAAAPEADLSAAAFFFPSALRSTAVEKADQTHHHGHHHHGHHQQHLDERNQTQAATNATNSTNTTVGEGSEDVNNNNNNTATTTTTNQHSHPKDSIEGQSKKVSSIQGAGAALLSSGYTTRASTGANHRLSLDGGHGGGVSGGGAILGLGAHGAMIREKKRKADIAKRSAKLMRKFKVTNVDDLLTLLVRYERELDESSLAKLKDEDESKYGMAVVIAGEIYQQRRAVLYIKGKDGHAGRRRSSNVPSAVMVRAADYQQQTISGNDMVREADSVLNERNAQAIISISGDQFQAAKELQTVIISIPQPIALLAKADHPANVLSSTLPTPSPSSNLSSPTTPQARRGDMPGAVNEEYGLASSASASSVPVAGGQRLQFRLPPDHIDRVFSSASNLDSVEKERGEAFKSQDKLSVNKSSAMGRSPNLLSPSFEPDQQLKSPLTPSSLFTSSDKLITATLEGVLLPPLAVLAAAVMPLGGQEGALGSKVLEVLGLLEMFPHDNHKGYQSPSKPTSPNRQLGPELFGPLALSGVPHPRRPSRVGSLNEQAKSSSNQQSTMNSVLNPALSALNNNGAGSVDPKLLATAVAMLQQGLASEERKSKLASRIAAAGQRFSVRQLPSWKLAVQRATERKAEAAEAQDKVEQELTYFSTLPFVNDDYAEIDVVSKYATVGETGIQGSPKSSKTRDEHNTTVATPLSKEEQEELANTAFKTDQQIRNDNFIKFMDSGMPVITLIISTLQLVYFCAVLFEICFGRMMSQVDLLAEWLTMDIPMIVFVAWVGISPRKVKGVYLFDESWFAAAKRYVTSKFFIFEFLGMIPLDVIGLYVGPSCMPLTNNCDGVLAPYWRLNRLLLARFSVVNFSDIIDDISTERGWFHPMLGRFILMYIYFFMVVHAISCFLNLILDAYPYLATTWKFDPIYFERTEMDKYFQCMDWSTKTAVGFWQGENFNLTTLTLLYVLIASFLGIGIFAALVGALGAWVSVPTPFYKTCAHIDAIYDAKSHGLMDDQLYLDIRKYYWHMYNSNSMSGDGGDGGVISALEGKGIAKRLQVKLLSQMGRDMIMRVPLLHNEAKNDQFVRALAVSLVPVILPPFTVFFRKGDDGDSMAFVTHGSMGVVSPTFEETHDESASSVFFVLKNGSFFGEIALVLGVKRTATVSSLSQFANLLVLSKDNFDVIGQDFPSVFTRLQLEAEARLAGVHGNPEALNALRMNKLWEALRVSGLRFYFKQWVDFLKMRMREQRLAANELYRSSAASIPSPVVAEGQHLTNFEV